MMSYSHLKITESVNCRYMFSVQHCMHASILTRPWRRKGIVYKSQFTYFRLQHQHCISFLFEIVVLKFKLTLFKYITQRISTLVNLATYDLPRLNEKEIIPDPQRKRNKKKNKDILMKKLLTPCSFAGVRHFVHSPAYGCSLSLAT